MFKLHAKGISKAFHCVFGGTVAPLDRQRAIRERAAHVYQGAAAMSQMVSSSQRAVDQAPIIGFEQLALIFNGDLAEFSVDRNSGVVYPGVKAAELFDGNFGKVAHLVRIA